MKQRGIVVLGPAWYSCGSYEVFKRQMECCRALGLKTYFLAVSAILGISEASSGYWNYYDSMTTDLDSDFRGHTGRKRNPFTHKAFWTEVLPGMPRSLSHWRTFPSRLSNIPRSLISFINEHDIDTVICHHFFNVPLAKRIQQYIPNSQLLLETQDLQSRHMYEGGGKHPLFRRGSSFETLLADEIHIARQADVLIHYNEDETAEFTKYVPDRRHITIFPAAPRNYQTPAAAPAEENVFDFLIVASGNDPNYNSLCWFLRDVWSPELDARFKLKIVGNVDVLFPMRGEPLYDQYRHCFLGRVQDLAELYRAARYVLLPVTQGHGIAIKTVEALSFGKHIVAMPLAYRGYQDRVPADLQAERVLSAQEFRDRLLTLNTAGPPQQDPRTAALYETLFSPEKQLEIYRGLLIH